MNIIKQFVAEQGLTFPIIQDRSNNISQNYYLGGGLSPFPRDFIIDQNGFFRYTSTEYRIDDMILVIESLLEEETAVEEENENTVLPRNYVLEQNFPNPFNPATEIKYSIAEDQFVELSVFDTLGKKVMQLQNQYQVAGQYSVEFDGSSLPSGIYYYRLNAGRFNESKKMLLLK